MAQGRNDPVGVGIKSPLSFEGGGLNYTASTYVDVSGDAGIGPNMGFGGPARLLDPNASSFYSTGKMLVATLNEQKQVIFQSISRIIKTPVGSRFMNGEFGSYVDDIVFDLNEPVIHSLAASYASVAVQQWEPRVEINRISVDYHPSKDYAMVGVLDYTIVGTALVTGNVTFEVEGETNE